MLSLRRKVQKRAHGSIRVRAFFFVACGYYAQPLEIAAKTADRDKN